VHHILFVKRKWFVQYSRMGKGHNRTIPNTTLVIFKIFKIPTLSLLSTFEIQNQILANYSNKSWAVFDQTFL
jgi:hypothetical protein